MDRKRRRGVRRIRTRVAFSSREPIDDDDLGHDDDLFVVAWPEAAAAGRSRRPRCAPGVARLAAGIAQGNPLRPPGRLPPGTVRHARPVGPGRQEHILATLIGDVRHALRQFSTARVFTITAVLTLASGSAAPPPSSR